MWKKMTALVLTLALMPAAAFAAPAQKAEIKVAYNQKAIQFPDQKPVILNSRTLVPIRPIAESLGFTVGWNEKTRTVTINKGTSNVSLVVSQKIAKRNGETITLDVPAQILNQRTVVPVRFIAEALNYKVDWEQASQTVKISDNPVAQTPATQQPQEQTNTQPAAEPVNKAALIDEDSIMATSFNIVGVVGAYHIEGTVSDETDKVTVEFDGKTYEVNLNDDGEFELDLNGDPDIEDFTIKAVADGAEDVFSGTFEVRD
ncbi:copper amine oxidase N-terminal domain-containing protein [Brevibacillus migulae]|uniref:copper amine oxidase N-terminal domain-containing protein n=1 Tax=Brevibacillus migulae TaxID=1644114 RepID=UPI00106E96D4|nr:copper amine oxidase N-terminal domain-containing protein [Brevibacillus migulae]